MDKDKRIRQHGQPSIDLIGLPMQHMPVLVREMCQRKRTRSQEGRRNETKGLEEIDAEVSMAAEAEIPDEDKVMLQIVHPVSAWLLILHRKRQMIFLLWRCFEVGTLEGSSRRTVG